jgi:general secretion pathway protein G
MRDKINRDTDRQRRELIAPEDLRLTRRPAVLGGILFFLLLVGGLLVSRANRLSAPETIQRVQREERAGRDLYALRIALERFCKATGRYPTDEEGLKALVVDPGIPGWSGHYVTVVKPDPWRTPYQYKLTPDGPDLRSCGPDRQPFTQDDILPEAPEGDSFTQN